MRNYLYKCTISIIFILLVLPGCAQTQKSSKSSDVKVQFLTEFFTSDYNQRYTKYEKSDNSADEKAKSAYYQDLSELVTSDCLDTMMKNRDPLKLDKDASVKNIQYKPENISIELYDEKNNVYSFSLELKSKSKKNSDTIIQGQITVIKEKDKELVKNYYIGKTE